MLRSFIIIVFFLLLVFETSQAESCSQKQLSLLIENDSALTLGGGTDRFYSNGLEAIYRCQLSLNNEDSQANIAFRSLNWLNNNSNVIKVNNGIKLGQKIYTSSDLSLFPNEIDTNRDRPYAGWSYISLFYEAETLQDRYIKHEFSLGCVGPCSQAENIQTEWHEL